MVIWGFGGYLYFMPRSVETISWWMIGGKLASRVYHILTVQ